MDILLDNFKYLTHSPKNVDQLKKLVLQLAVQGKLTVKWREENPDVEPASVLLEKIRAEKEILIKNKVVKIEKPLLEISDSEKQYEIPNNWAWERVGEISFIGTGATPSTANPEYYNGNIPWISSSSTSELFVVKADKLITEKAVKETNCSVFPIGTLIIALYGQGKTRGQITELLIESSTNQACAAIVLHFNNKTLRNYIKYFFLENYEKVRSFASGGSQPNLNLSKIKNTVIPIPPLEEQLAINSKVESLFAQIDQLHELASKKASITDNSAKALFGKINTTTDKQDLQQIWQLLTNNFNTVTQSKEGVNQLRQTILQLAFQGKLTAKWRVENPFTIPASAILEEIKAEKQQLTKEGNLRKELHVHKIAQNEQPFEIPVSWEWDRMGAISQHNSGKTLDSGRNKGDLHKYITTSNLYWGYFKLDNVKSFLISDNELDRCSAIKGDLLICEGGEAGRTAVWEESYSICFQNHIHRVRLYGNINP